MTPGSSNPRRVALLAIDLQQGFVHGPPALLRATDLLDVSIRMVTGARERGIPVVHLRIDGPVGHPTETGTPGWQFVPCAQPAPGELVLAKKGCDSFRGTGLHEHLGSKGIGRLILIGCVSELCVDTTCRVALYLGYEVTIVSDAHSTPDAMREGYPDPQGRLRMANHIWSVLGDADAVLHVRPSSDLLAVPSW